MAVADDAVGPSSAGTSGQTSTITWSHTCTGSNRVLYVGLSVGKPSDSTVAITGITYNSVALTSLGSRHANDQTDGRAELWRLVAPATGANTVAISFTGGPLTSTDVIVGGSVSLTGVDQTTPDSGFTSAAGSGTAPSVNVSSATGDRVIDVVCNGSAISSSGQTNKWLDNVNLGSAGGNAAMSTAAGGTTVTMSYTVTSDWWAILAINVKAVGGGGGATVTYPELERMTRGYVRGSH